MNTKNLFKNIAQKVKDTEYKLGLIADYVVETGTSGIWTYEKWKSGKAVCWGKQTSTLVNGQIWASPIYSAQPERPNYPFTFLEPPTETAIVTNSTNACWLYKQAGENNTNTTTTTTNYWAIKVNAFDANSMLEISYHVIGRWK